MKDSKISQVLYDMKHQPVVSAVTLIGTALAIFLIMVVVMMHTVTVAPFSPEGNRNRVLHGKYLHIRMGEGESSADMSYSVARKLYDKLDGAETTTFFLDYETVDVTAPGEPAFLHISKQIDDKFWKVFDYKFIAGKPIDSAQHNAGMHVAVINETIARELFPSCDEAIGKQVLIEQQPFTVVGVVEDASPLAETAFSEVFIPFTSMGSQDETWGDGGYLGPFSCAILAESSSEFDNIRAQVQARKNALKTELEAEGKGLYDHGSPFTQEQSNYAKGSNSDPSDKVARNSRMIVYLILLIIPAINLSSMTQSRLRRRLSEIGVRRAFGCTRSRIVIDILAENFIITLAGGLLGMLFCFIFGIFFSSMIFTDMKFNLDADVSLSMLFNWSMFGSALLFCFILNLLSSGIPAWKASRVPPVEAINSRNI